MLHSCSRVFFSPKGESLIRYISIFKTSCHTCVHTGSGVPIPGEELGKSITGEEDRLAHQVLTDFLPLLEVKLTLLLLRGCMDTHK